MDEWDFARFEFKMIFGRISHMYNPLGIFQNILKSCKMKICRRNFNTFIYSKGLLHDDVIKWKHFPSHWPFGRGIQRSPVNSPHKGQWRGALMLSLICAWINDWVNNREAGDLRRHPAHNDVIVMYFQLPVGPSRSPSSSPVFWSVCWLVSASSFIGKNKVTYPW